MKTLKIAIITLLIAGLNPNLYAQEFYQNIRGNVSDVDSKLPVIGANVIISGSDPIQGASTDVNGDFYLQNVAIGRVNLKVSAIGYEAVFLNNILVESAKESILEIEMRESYEMLEAVTITAEEENGESVNKMALISAKSVTVEETGRYAGALNDPARMVSAFAGVSGDAEGNNDIVVRGNSPRGLLWRLEGVEIPNPNHFAEQGSSGGPVNTLNASMLATSDFFSGAFAPEYGNALSGVFDTRFRNGNNQQGEYRFSLGVLGTDITLEGPMAKDYNGSYLINYRYSTLDLLDGLGIVDFGGVPKYQDASFKLNLPSKKYGNFTLFGLGGLSGITDNSEEEETQKLLNTTKVSAGLGVLGLKHNYFLSNKTYLSSYVSFSKTHSGVNVSELDQAMDAMYEYYDEDFTESKWRFSTSLNTKFNAKNTLNTGVIYSLLGYDMTSWLNQDNTVAENLLMTEGHTSTLQVYSTWKHRLRENITLVSGLHYTQLFLNNNFSIEPRAAVQWQVNPKNGLSFGFGLHSKVENVSIYLSSVDGDPNNLANKDLELSKAAHFVVGYSHRFNENLLFKSEVYYQHLYDVPVENDLTSTFSVLNMSGGYVNLPLNNNGFGRNYGVELTLERFYAKQFYYMLTGSLYQSKYKAMDGVERNTYFNANYASNLVLGKEFNLRSKKNQKTLAVNIKASYLGGNHITPIDLDASIAEGKAVYDEENAFSQKMDDFTFMNLGVTYRVNKQKVTHEFKLDIQNVLNAQSVVDYYYNADEETIEESYQLGLIPNLMYIIKF